ncbi:MAG: hypothetical protein V3T18_11850 [Pseudomonadales bacterium]
MWFEALFGYPVAAFESAVLVFSNVIDPLWWIVGAVLVCAVIVASVVVGERIKRLAGWQRIIIAGLQCGVALGVIGLLAGPALQTTTLQPGANSVAVLVDTSGSMDFQNDPAADDQTRLDAAVDLVTRQLIPALADLAEIVVFTFDSSAVRLESLAGVAASDAVAATVTAAGAGTNLLASTNAVLSSFRGMPLAAVVVLSDGADNDVGSTLDTADLATHGVPVHTIGFGPGSLPGEVQLADVRLAADAPPGSRVSASVVIEHTSAGEAIVRVRDGGTLLALRTVQLPVDSPTVRTRIEFDSGSAGIRELSFEVEPPAGDQLALNNRIQRLLTVNERHRRILYLEGEPRWEYKFLRRAVAGDDVLELVSWLRTTDRKTYRQGVSREEELADGFPPDLASLYGYDVIVLGSLAATSLTSQQHAWLESFVAERGGSLLALAGREALADGGWDVQPLAAALPVVLNRQSGPTYGPVQGSVRPTREGLTSPLTRLADGEGVAAWETLPALGDYQRLGELKPAATTLLELVQGETVSPLLVTQPYGLGTTAVLATATTWRWQMRTPPDDPRHAIFWRQLLRQLAETAQRPRNVDLVIDGDSLVVRAWVRDETFEPARNVSASALISHADRSQTRLNLAPGAVPGVLAARHVFGAPGVYRVDVELTDLSGTQTMTRFVRSGVENREYFRPVQNESLLRRLADATGGRYWAPEDVAEIATALTFAGTGIRSVEFLPLWQAPIFFALLVLMKLAEWSLRRYWGSI